MRRWLVNGAHKIIIHERSTLCDGTVEMYELIQIWFRLIHIFEASGLKIRVRTLLQGL